jgi:hypothetical protein
MIVVPAEYRNGIPSPKVNPREGSLDVVNPLFVLIELQKPSFQAAIWQPTDHLCSLIVRGLIWNRVDGLCWLDSAGRGAGKRHRRAGGDPLPDLHAKGLTKNVL